MALLYWLPSGCRRTLSQSKVITVGTCHAGFINWRGPSLYLGFYLVCNSSSSSHLPNVCICLASVVGHSWHRLWQIYLSNWLCVDIGFRLLSPFLGLRLLSPFSGFSPFFGACVIIVGTHINDRYEFSFALYST